MSGIDECRVNLMKLKLGKATANFFEGMACDGGCINGALCLTHSSKDLVELRASFCLGCCAQGVTVKAEGLSNAAVEHLENGDVLLHNVNSQNVEDIFLNQIYPYIKK